MTKSDKLSKIADSIVNDITDISLADDITVETNTPVTGIYCSALTWTKQGKTSLYPSVVMVSPNLYKGSKTITLEQLAILFEHAETIKALLAKRASVERLLRKNPDKYLTPSIVFKAMEIDG